MITGAMRGCSTRKLSTSPKLSDGLSDIVRKGAQYPAKTLLEFRGAFVMVAIFRPLRDHSTVLPCFEMITSHHTNPTVPGLSAPFCCGYVACCNKGGFCPPGKSAL